jgi:mRNA interferase RelE/StbE
MAVSLNVKIEYAKKAVKAINVMDTAIKSRIKSAIEGLTAKPPQGDIKPLKGYKDNRYRLRVGGYRIIFLYRQDGGIEILYIMDIGSRGDIYKGM